MRSALDVSSYALTQSSLFAYSYRADGRLEQQQINLNSNGAVGNSALNFTYSSAGRLQQRTESGPAANGSPTQFSYDPSYGFLNSVTYPAGSEPGLEYDAAGMLLGESSSAWYKLSMRGEQVYDAANTATSMIADGVSAAKIPVSGTATQSVDGRMGVELGSTSTSTRSGTTTQGVSFDAAGRETDDSTGWQSYDQQSGFNTDMTRTYDQDNHVTSSAYNNDYNGIPGADPLSWGLPALRGKGLTKSGKKGGLVCSGSFY